MSPKNIILYGHLKLSTLELLGACENDVATGAHSHPKFFVVKAQCFIACQSIDGGNFEANLGHLKILFVWGYQLLTLRFGQFILFWAHTIYNCNGIMGQITIRQGFLGNLEVGQRVFWYSQNNKYIHDKVACFSASNWCDCKEINSIKTLTNTFHLSIMGLILEVSALQNVSADTLGILSWKKFFTIFSMWIQ